MKSQIGYAGCSGALGLENWLTESIFYLPSLLR